MSVDIRHYAKRKIQTHFSRDTILIIERDNKRLDEIIINHTHLAETLTDCLDKLECLGKMTTRENIEQAVFQFRYRNFSVSEFDEISYNNKDKVTEIVDKKQALSIENMATQAKYILDMMERFKSCITCQFFDRCSVLSGVYVIKIDE